MPAAALLLGLSAGSALAGAADGTEPTLLTLLRFMAIVKGALALAAGAALTWRSFRPIPGGARIAYLLFLTILAAGPVPIWAGAQVWAGALLVHSGLIGLAVTAWRDRAGWNRAAWDRAGWHRAARRPA